jgi:glycosyltransferase involved in cell wall biosynthesis
MPIEISVVICTYNRASLLTGAIESICQQTLAPDQYEILVVDNASTDNTTEVVRTFQEKNPYHQIRWVYEARQGVGHARNTALSEVAGKFVAYLDDDAKADLNWLTQAEKRLLDSRIIHCLGGPIHPFYTSGKPTWFKNQYELRTWGKEERSLISGESLSGSNMIWRKETLQMIGGFGEMVGPVGNIFSVGEDTMAFKRLWKYIPEAMVIYDPNLIVFHWVPPYKMMVSHYIKRAFINGQVAIKLDQQPVPGWRLRTALRSIGAVIIRASRALWHFPRYQNWHNWAIEECMPVASKYGTCLAACGIVIKIKQK